jgi:OPA family glycerol-3-phosphate transporter-like MFS transporter 1/2
LLDRGLPDKNGVRNEGKNDLGLVDSAFLFSYAFGLFFSGSVADRSDLRLFLSTSMLGEPCRPLAKHSTLAA